MRPATLPTLAAAIALFPSNDTPLAALLPTGAKTATEQLARLDRLCGLAVVGSEGCLARLEPTWRDQAAQTAVFCGSRDGCLATDTAFFRGVQNGEASPRLFAYTLHSAPVGAVSIQHGLLGPGATVIGSQVAGLQALEEATLLLSSGRARACLVLSCDLAWSPGVDAVAALYLTSQPASLIGYSAWKILDIHSFFVAEQPDIALSRALAALHQRVPQSAAALAVSTSGPPLATLAALLDEPSTVHPQLNDPSQSCVVITSQDAQGYAAAAVIGRDHCVS